jgi:poly-gamma-glutamate synthesis protein (capsule biosynthesis protein)
MIDAGADLIIGHHPHVPHAVEIYKGKVVFYSLGNFVFQYDGFDELHALLKSIGMDLNVKDAGRDTFIVGADIQSGGQAQVCVIPICIDDEGFPQKADPAAAAKVIENLQRLSKGKAMIAADGVIGPPSV